MYPKFSFLNIYAPNARAPTFKKETLLKPKAHIAPHTIIVGDFNTPLSSMDRSEKQTKQRNSETNRSYKPNGCNISIRHFILKQKNKPSFRHIMVPSPTLIL